MFTLKGSRGGFLGGFGTVRASSLVVAGAIDAGGTIKGNRLWASGLGAAGTPAVAIGVIGDNGMYASSASIMNLVTEGGIAVQYGSGGWVYTGGAMTISGSLAVATFIEFSQIATPAAPAAGKTRIYGVDNGGSKTQFRALFDTGVGQAMATEP